MKRPHLPLSLAAALLACAVPSAKADVLFDDFETGYVSGALQGQTGGSGWTTPWTASAAFTVVESAGNETVDVNLAGNALNAAGRTYDVTEPVQTAPNGSITFSIRLDSLGGFLGGNASGDDYISIFDRNFALTTTDFGSEGTWMIRGGYAGNTASSLEWRLYNGGKNAGTFSNAALVGTGIAMTAGTTYDFQVNFLGSGDWSASVSDGTNPAFNSGTLGFRSAASGPSGNLFFNLRNAGATTAPAGVNYDILHIAAVPEPSTALMVLGGVALLGMNSRWRRA